jgi:hypothetical protein
MNSSKYSAHIILMQILTAKYIVTIIAVILFIWPSEQQRISPEEDEDQNSKEHSIGNHEDQNTTYLRFMAHGFLLSSLDCCWKLQLLPLFFKCVNLTPLSWTYWSCEATCKSHPVLHLDIKSWACCRHLFCFVLFFFGSRRIEENKSMQQRIGG